MASGEKDGRTGGLEPSEEWMGGWRCLEGDTKGNSGSTEEDELLVDTNGSGCGASFRRRGSGSRSSEG